MAVSTRGALQSHGCVCIDCVLVALPLRPRSYDLDRQSVTLSLPAEVSGGDGTLTLKFRGKLDDNLCGFYRCVVLAGCCLCLCSVSRGCRRGRAYCGGTLLRTPRVRGCLLGVLGLRRLPVH